MSTTERPQNNQHLRATVVSLLLALFGCDHASKNVAEAALSNGRVVNLVTGGLELRYARNPDTAFSLFRVLGLSPSPSLLLLSSLLATAFVGALWFFARKRSTRQDNVGYALVLAGALGNVVDRAARGYVVDFIHITHWPIFNVADVAIVVGTMLLGWSSFRKKGRKENAFP
jgi:signal peptidase II